MIVALVRGCWFEVGKQWPEGSAARWRLSKIRTVSAATCSSGYLGSSYYVMTEWRMSWNHAPILCFEHCQKGTRVTCLKIPDRCPVCHNDMSSGPMILPPFRLPSPFCAASEAPYSVVIKPTVGDFLNDYETSKDLHIGVTNSQGVVYEYNEQGVLVGHGSQQVVPEGWSQCLTVPLLDPRNPHDSQLTFDWDDKLSIFSTQSEWTAARYQEEGHNCYDFVLRFLQYAGLHARFPCERLQFCEQYILPRTSKAAKYISLYHKLKQDGCSVVDSAASSEVTRL